MTDLGKAVRYLGIAVAVLALAVCVEKYQLMRMSQRVSELEKQMVTVKQQAAELKHKSDLHDKLIEADGKTLAGLMGGLVRVGILTDLGPTNGR